MTENKINTYISAEEARKMSDEISTGKMTEELDSIYSMINNAILKGNTKITCINKTLLKSTKDFLLSKGFKVEHFSGCQWDPANDTIISW